MGANFKFRAQPHAVSVDLGRPNSAPQREFFGSHVKYTCYGGARGGGKTWCVRAKVVGGALAYPGIKILVIRRAYEDSKPTIIEPIRQMVPQELAAYNETQHQMFFANGSQIKFGNMPGYGAAVAGKYQGQEYDWIFMDEATQFTESEFRGIAACLRGVNKIPKRFYLTCNPGGIGHAWVKRLFIERRFKENENPHDYKFIRATVEDNVDLMETQPDYLAALELLPEDIRRAHRYGDWDALAGTYFSEFREAVHVCAPFEIPASWPRYRAFDYGLDMFACLWVAVDTTGRCYVYREFAEPDLVVSAAADAMLSCTAEGETIQYTIAPPDMWNRQKDTGKSMAELYMQAGVGLVKASNSRVQGWMALKEMLKLRPDGKPGLLIFENCKGLREFLPLLQHDDANPSDVSKQPHDITHIPDALRYFAVMRTLPAKVQAAAEPEEDEPASQRVAAYDAAMCGGLPTDSYINYR